MQRHQAVVPTQVAWVVNAGGAGRYEHRGARHERQCRRERRGLRPSSHARKVASPVMLERSSKGGIRLESGAHRAELCRGGLRLAICWTLGRQSPHRHQYASVVLRADCWAQRSANASVDPAIHILRAPMRRRSGLCVRSAVGQHRALHAQRTDVGGRRGAQSESVRPV